MPIAVAAKICALLNGLTTDQLNELSPVERRKFAEICLHWFQLADRPQKIKPKAGVLADLPRAAHCNRHE
jgi:hypothetical protein